MAHGFGAVTSVMEENYRRVMQATVEDRWEGVFDPPLGPRIPVPPGGWSPPATERGTDWGLLLIAGAVVALVALNIRARGGEKKE